jgi:hypothetical protein
MHHCWVKWDGLNQFNLRAWHPAIIPQHILGEFQLPVRTRRHIPPAGQNTQYTAPHPAAIDRIIYPIPVQWDSDI